MTEKPINSVAEITDLVKEIVNLNYSVEQDRLDDKASGVITPSPCHAGFLAVNIVSTSLGICNLLLKFGL